MRNLLKLLSLLALLGVAPSLIEAQSNEGTDFWCGFMEHRDENRNTKVLMITSKQNTGGNVAGGQFGGFGEPSLTTLNNNNLVHNVDAIDAHGKLTYGGFTIIGEYLTAMRRFATMDMTFGRNGAEPSALHAEIDYTLPFEIKRETVIGFAYGETWEALALNLPKNSYTTFISTSLLRDTVESLEYRHDTDYAATDVASGRGASTPIRGTGKDRNSVIAQVGVYF